MRLPKFTSTQYQNEALKLKRFKIIRSFILIGFTLGIIGLILSSNLLSPETISQVIASATTETSTSRDVVPATYQNINNPNNSGDPTYKTSYTQQDPRAFVLDKYFEMHNSPLQGTGDLIIQKCKEYQAPQDCLIIPAIADAETDLCKYHTSASYYNCWGFGGGGEYRIYFNSWEESIDRVYRTLATSGLYGNDVMIDPRLMERTFCGWEPGCTSWGLRVISIMDSIDAFAKQQGIDKGMYGFR